MAEVGEFVRRSKKIKYGCSVHPQVPERQRCDPTSLFVTANHSVQKTEIVLTGHPKSPIVIGCGFLGFAVPVWCCCRDHQRGGRAAVLEEQFHYERHEQKRASANIREKAPWAPSLTFPTTERTHSMKSLKTLEPDSAGNVEIPGLVGRGSCRAAPTGTLHLATLLRQGAAGRPFLNQPPTEGPRQQPILAFAIGLILLASITAVQAQWIAYNDHNRGVGTAPFVSTYSLTKSGNTLVPAGGPLTNFATGLAITNSIGVVSMSISATGSVDGTTSPSITPSNDTPAGQLFNGKIDWNFSGIQFGGLSAWATSSVTVAFTNLTPGRRYKFRGTGGRGSDYPNPYTNRWTLATLAGANNATHAHLMATNSPGIVTNGWSPYGDTLDPQFQALWNSGINTCGDVIGWDEIVPINHSFSVICSNWTLAVPTQLSGTNEWSVFAFSAVSLEEVYLPIAIVAQPQNTVVCSGGSAGFSVGLAGDQPGCQWYVITNGLTNLVPNATNATITVSNPDQPAAYFVIVTNAISAATSAVAHLTLGNNPIRITGQPQDQTELAGTTALFSVVVSTNTSQPISLQWYYSADATPTLANPIAGATNLTLTLSKIGSNQAGYYFALLTNCVNVVTSQVASLNVYYLPVQIAVQPQNNTVPGASTATLLVRATGSGPISYQWYKGNLPLPGQTNTQLILSNLQFFDSAYYHVVVANPAPSAVASSNALLLVNVPSYTPTTITQSLWKYNQDGVDLGTNWTAPGYDDSAWPSGKAALGRCVAYYMGAANNPCSFTNTALNLANTGSTNITYYFRTTFVLTNDPNIVMLITSNLYAHGLVAYLNGTEVYRMNMPPGTITYNTFSSSAIATNSRTTGVMWPTNIPMSLSSSLLVQGTNTLAVECHKYGLSAPDIYMGVSLSVSFPTPIPIQITNQPQSVTSDELRPISLTVGYVGSMPALQWYKQGSNGPVPISGATSPTLALGRPLAGVDSGIYFITLSNMLGQIVSATATLIITQATPSILSQPASQAVCRGQQALFQVAAYGAADSTYQWRLNNMDIPQATNTSFFVPFATISDAGTYSVLASNSIGATISSNASLVLLPDLFPVLAAQPTNQVGNLAGTIQWSVPMSGSGPCISYAYQWRFNGADIPGANASILTLTNLQTSNEGSYQVVITNTAGSITSAIAQLTINQATLDNGFDPQAHNRVNALAIQTDTKVLVGTLYGGAWRLNEEGMPDSTFNFELSKTGSAYALAIQTDGKILVGGQLEPPFYDLQRLNADGTIDSGFDPQANGTVYALAMQPDGKILVGGGFYQIGGQPIGGIARLNSDGTVDSGFNPGQMRGSYVSTLAIQTDGRILVGGNFIFFGGQSRSNIARLNVDGTLDNDFNPGPNDWVRSIVIQPDGKALVGGGFNMIGGHWVTGIARLNVDGSVDTKFSPGLEGTPVSISLQTDGKILVQGCFFSLCGQIRKNLGRLNADGTLDSGFNPGANATTYSLTLEPDGRILVGGDFTMLAGHPCNYIGRLNNTGPATQNLAYDGSTITWLRGGTSPEVWRTTFEQSTDGVNWTSLGAGTRIPGGWQLPGVVLPPGGLIRARGHITSGYHNASVWFAETITQPPWAAIVTRDGGFGVVSNGFGFNIGGSGTQAVVVEASTNLSQWSPVFTNAFTNGSFYFSDSQWTNAPARFYRLRSP